MTVRTLDHVNIRTDRLAETYAFYTELLGLTLTNFPGRDDLKLGGWLCDRTGRAVVHVGHVDASYGDGREGRPANRGSGAIHHLAFDCDDYDGLYRRITARGCLVRTNDVAAIKLRQIFVEDPNGITVELNFRS